MIKEYLVEVTKRCRQWVEAYDEEEAKTLAENMEEADNSEIDNVEILDEREDVHLHCQRFPAGSDFEEYSICSNGKFGYSTYVSNGF